MTLKRAKMKASSRVNSRETSSGVRKRHFLATGEISVRLKNVQMVFDSFATFFILLGGLVILTHILRKFVFVFPQTHLSQERLSLTPLSSLFSPLLCSQKARERRRKRSASLRSLLLSLSQWEIFNARVSSSSFSSSSKTRAPTSSFGFRPLKKKRFWRDKK